MPILGGVGVVNEGVILATKLMRVSDQSGKEIPEGTGAKVTIKFHDLRKGQKELDLTDDEAAKLGGRATKRRGRKPAPAAQK